MEARLLNGGGLVLAWKQQRRGSAICLRDDPNTFASHLIAGQNSQSVQNGEVVFFCILGRHVTPKAAVVLVDEGGRVDRMLNEMCKNTFRGDDSPQPKQWPVTVFEVWQRG